MSKTKVHKDQVFGSDDLDRIEGIKEAVKKLEIYTRENGYFSNLPGRVELLKEFAAVHNALTSGTQANVQPLFNGYMTHLIYSLFNHFKVQHGSGQKRFPRSNNFLRARKAIISLGQTVNRLNKLQNFSPWWLRSSLAGGETEFFLEKAQQAIENAEKLINIGE